MSLPRLRPFAFRIGLLLLLAEQAAAQNDLPALLERARSDERAGDYAGAARVYQEAIALAPGNLEVLKRVGVLEQTELKFDESIERFQQVLGRDPEYQDVNFFLGVSYLGKNETDHAMQSFRRELATPKPHPRCRYYLALALESSGQTEDAVAQLNQALVDNPKDMDALYQLARIHKKASLQAIDRLRAIDGDSFQLHALMGEIYADEERYADAIQEYRTALAKRPDARGIHFSMGVAYWTQSLWDAARTEFHDAWKENPQDALTNMYLGDIALEEERFAEALNYLRIAQQNQRNLPHLHALLGKCYRGQKDPESAKTEFLAAIESDPAAPELHYLLAGVYRDLHDPDARARELAQYEKLLQLQKDKAQEGDAAKSPSTPP